MRFVKAIEYAYPTSTNAELLGMADTGCYYVAQSILREDGNYSPMSPVHNAEGFLLPDDADLISLYLETEGEPAFSFLRYGHDKVLAAIAQAQVSRD